MQKLNTGSVLHFFLVVQADFIRLASLEYSNLVSGVFLFLSFVLEHAFRLKFLQ